MDDEQEWQQYRQWQEQEWCRQEQERYQQWQQGQERQQKTRRINYIPPTLDAGSCLS
jgi:hypothetical protein